MYIYIYNTLHNSYYFNVYNMLSICDITLRLTYDYENPVYKLYIDSTASTSVL